MNEERRSRFPHEDANVAPLDAAQAQVRKARLDAAARNAPTQAAAKAHLGAGRIAESLGDVDGAHERYEACLALAPETTGALLALGRLAFRSGGFAEAAELATREMELSPSPEARREILLHRAALELVRLAEASKADATLDEARRIDADGVRVALARAEVAFAAGRAREIPEIVGAAEVKADSALRGAFACLRACAADLAGDSRGATERWLEAVSGGIEAIARPAGTARSAAAGGDPGAEVEAWTKLSEAVPPGGVRTALLRRAARARHLAARDPKGALAILADLPSTPAVERARLAAAEEAGDAGEAVKAASALASLGPAAAALWVAARLLARDERTDIARRTLDDALAGDSGFVPAQIERDEILRTEGREAIAAELAGRGGHGPLRAAALLVDAGAEAWPAARAYLDAARESGRSTTSSDLVAALLALATGDSTVAAAALARVAENAVPGKDATALWLGVADVQERAGVDPRASIERVLPHPAARLAIRRLSAPIAQHAAAAAKIDATNEKDGRAKAAAVTDEGAAHERAGDQAAALDAHARALAVDPQAAASASARVRLLSGEDDASAAGALQELAAAAPDPKLAAPILVRAALRLRDTDRSAAREAVRAALASAPDDLALAEISASLGAGADAKARALLAAVEAEGEAAPLHRIVEAAEALQAAGLDEEAADLYRRALARAPGRPDLEAALVGALVGAGELPAVTDYLLAAVREAPDDAARAATLERLAEFDGNVRGDSASAAIAWSEVQAASPGHAASLRALERHLTGTGRQEDLLPILEVLVGSTGDDLDAAAFARRASRIRRLGSESVGVDDAALAELALARVPAGWALRAIEADARAAGPDGGGDEALASVAGRLAAASEGASRAAWAVAAGEALLRSGRTDDALVAFKGALEGDPEHPLALVRVAELSEGAGDLAVAAHALEVSGTTAADSTRGAADLFRAALLVEDGLGDSTRALALLRRALDRDPSRVDAIERAARILEATGETEEAQRMLARRIDLGGARPRLAALAEHEADLLVELGRREEALASLKKAISCSPDDVALLWRFADLAGEEGLHEQRAAALIEVARRVTAPEEVMAVFLELGRLYDGPLPDPGRAETSFRRVLQHDPNHQEAIERLVGLGMVGGNWRLARDACDRLVRLATTSEERARRLATLARIHEEGFKDVRRAEALLQEARRIAPTDPMTIDEGTAFYGRQGGGPPLAMWLDIAASALRDAIAAAPHEPSSYRTLARVHESRGRLDASRAALAVAAALGGTAEGDAERLRTWAAAAPRALVEGAVSVLLLPPSFPAALREIFARLAPGFSSLAPSDPKDHGASRSERLSPQDPVRVVASRVAREVGLRDIEVYALPSPTPDRVLPGDPPTLVTSRASLEGADEAEIAFRVGRAAFLASWGLAAPLLFTEADLELLLLGLVRLFDTHFPCEGHDEAAVEEATRRMGRHVSRRDRDTIMPFALEAAGARALEAAAVREAVGAGADAAGLLACGRVDGALRAIGREIGVGIEEAARTPRGAALLAFSVSDEYFEACRIAGIG